MRQADIGVVGRWRLVVASLVFVRDRRVLLTGALLG